VLEPPDIPSERLIEAVQETHSRRVTSIRFLPVGLDPRSSVFRVRFEAGADALLKVKEGGFAPAALHLPRWLHAGGREEFVAPVSGRGGSLRFSLGPSVEAALYPWVEGPRALDQGLDRSQSYRLGELLRHLHSVEVPDHLGSLMRVEAFVAPEAEQLGALAELIEVETFPDMIRREFTQFWHDNKALISSMAERCEELGKIASNQIGVFVPCHADIHLANVLIEPSGDLRIIDWDECKLAPKERDLMFLLSQDVIQLPRPVFDVAAFQEGYGGSAVDPWMMSWYRYAWVVQELAEFGWQVVWSEPLSPTARDGWVRFQQLFAKGDVVEQALLSEPL